MSGLRLLSRQRRLTRLHGGKGAHPRNLSNKHFMKLEIWLSEPSKGAIRLLPQRKKGWKKVAPAAEKSKAQNRRLSYHEYIKSDLWRLRRYVYFKQHPRRCTACPARSGVTLHHLSYENLGNEPDEDLVALCWECHGEFHAKHGVKAKRMRQETLAFIADKKSTLTATKKRRAYLPFVENVDDGR
jgi:hypothetical protein